jgi:hypothetical protein
MLHTRLIRPGICTNETLAELGPFATLLFERLWMLADREGRLEYRPDRIRAEVFPYWPDVPVKKLVENLARAGLVVIYETPVVVCLSVVAFKKHQKVHAHEKKSVLPPPPELLKTNNNKDYIVATCSDNGEPCRDMSPPTVTVTDIEKYYGEIEGECEGEEDPPPPPSAKKKPDRKRRSPEKAKPASSDSANGAIGERDAEMLRGLLTEIGRPARLPPVDDAMLRQIIEAGHGARADEICLVIRRLWQRERFRSIRSWGLVPVVVGGLFRAA